jgi:hypothetical protein
LTGAVAGAAKLNGISSGELTATVANASELTGLTSSELLTAVGNAPKLNGITAFELNGAITNAAKLTGVSGPELVAAVAEVPRVGALCTRTTILTTQSNALLSSLGEISLSGVIPLGLKLSVPGLPSPLGAFACP